jgi:hypothetical protein
LFFVFSCLSDALQIIWPLSKDTNLAQEKVINIVSKVAQRIASIVWNVEDRKSFYKIPRDFNSNILNGLFLRVKVSLALGDIFVAFVGEAIDTGRYFIPFFFFFFANEFYLVRLEVLIAGNLINELAVAEHHHKVMPSTVILTSNVWDVIKKSFKSNDLGNGFRELLFSTNESQIETSRRQNRTEIEIVSRQNRSDVNGELSRFVPLHVIKFNGLVFPELRKVTTMFILLHQDFLSSEQLLLLSKATDIIVVCVLRCLLCFVFC